jgi:K+-sensing histidine kinase KdpD
MDESHDYASGVRAVAPAPAPRPSREALRETRILVLLPERPQASSLVRWAERLARIEGGSFWCARLVGPEEHSGDSLEVDVRSAYQLADEFGGHNVELRADSLFDELFRFTAQQRITHIVVGKPRGVPLVPFLAATLPGEFVVGEGGPRIVVVSEAATDSRPADAGVKPPSSHA